MQHFSLVLFICGLEASVGISCFLTEGEGGAGESGLSANHRQSMRTGGGHVTLGSEVQQRRVGGLGDFSHHR